jgi:hypothetical protein
MHNIFRKNPVKVVITDIAGKKIDELLFVSSKKGGLDFFGEVAVDFVILDLFPEDSVHDLKEKIFLATDIFPSEQCLIYNGQIISSDTNIMGKETDEKIAGIPINKVLFLEREDVRIINLEFETLDNIFTDGFEIECRSLKSVEKWPDKDLDLIYWSLVPYFPHFTELAFKEYTVSRNREKYPLLFPDKNSVLRRQKKQTEALNKVYDALSGGQLKNYNISLIEGCNDAKAELKFIITEMFVLVQKRGAVNLENLFTILNTTEKLPVVIYNSKTVAFTKVFYGSENKVPLSVYRNSHVSVYIACDRVVFEIREDGSIYAILYNAAAENLDFNKAEDLIENDSATLFAVLDKLKLSVFKIEPVLDYYAIIRISCTLVWFRAVDDFPELLKRMLQSELVEQKSDKLANKFTWVKGAQTHVINDANEFIYLTNSSYSQQYINYFEVDNKYTEVIFTTKGMSDTDFKNFMKFLAFTLSGTKTSDISTIKKNNLKMLKILDPVTYEMGKATGNKVYARLCQKQKQPVPLMPEDVKDADAKNVIKFWNYTKEKEMYYSCPNNQYPFPGFLVGAHPNGHCLVCCKKKKIKESKYEKIHAICMEDHYYRDKKDLSQARYVMNFGKDLDPGRLGYMPNILIKFLHFNHTDMEIISEAVTLNVFRYEGSIYSVERLGKILKNTRVQELPLAVLEDFLNYPVWRRKRKGAELIKPIEIIKNPTADPKINKRYKKIMKSDLENPIFVHLDEKSGKYVVLDGIHRLALAFIKKHTFIKCKLVSEKQMQRAKVGKYSVGDSSFLPDAVAITVKAKTGGKIHGQLHASDPSAIPHDRDREGGNDKEPFYYVYGVNRMVGEIKCSFLHSTASAFQMNVDCFVNDILTRLGGVEFVGKHLALDLWQIIKTNFVEKKFVADNLNWEEIFFEILPALYQFTPIVLEYVGQEEMKLYMPLMSGDWEDVDFIIYLKNGGSYNPIFITIPYIFSKDRKTEKRVLAGDDIFVKLLNTISSRQSEDLSFTINKISQFFKITKVFSFGGVVYAVEVGGKAYCAVEQSKINDLDYEMLEVKKYGLVDAVGFLASFSEKFGTVVNVHSLFVQGGRVVAYGVEDIVNFVSCTEAEALKYWPGARVFHWNYAPETIINAKTNVADPLYDAYMKLNAGRDEFEFFKEKFVGDLLKKKALADFKNKGKPKDVMEKAVWEEMQNPIKFRLMESGIFGFKKMFLQKQKNENIYIRLK